MFLLKISCTTVCLIQCFVKVDVRNFLDLEAIASDDFFLQMMKNKSQIVRHICTSFILFILILFTFNR